jgi:hypothetical protein
MPDATTREDVVSTRGRPLQALPSPDAWLARERFKRLRGETLRGQLGASNPRAGATLEALWRRLEQLGGEVSGGELWQLVGAHDPAPWFGAPLTLVFADRERSREEALAPLLNALGGPGLHARGDALVEVDARDTELLEGLGALGWQVAHVVTVGEVAEATRLLGIPSGGALDDTPIRRCEIEAVLALHAAVFSEDARWCWFGAAQGHLERLRRELELAVAQRAPEARHRVLRGVDGEVAGHLGVELSESPFLGLAVDVSLVLAPSLRGRGVLRSAWRLALEDAVGWGARCWKGGTMQPSVLSLGSRLGRRWARVGLRRVGGIPVEDVARWPGGWRSAADP